VFLVLNYSLDLGQPGTADRLAFHLGPLPDITVLRTGLLESVPRLHCAHMVYRTTLAPVRSGRSAPR